MKTWKSLDEYRNDPEWQKAAEREFLSSPWFEEDIRQFEAESKGKDSWARREFLKLMGASIAMSSFACVRRPVQKIVPYVKAPADMVPGIANYYSSTWVDRGMVYGLLVKTREGRPIKLEGHPHHPSNKGALTARGQAQLLSLYDPARLSGPRKFNPGDVNPFRRTTHPNWADLDKEVVEVLNKGGVALLTSSLASPSTKAVIQDFSRTFGAKHYVWDAINYDVVRAGQEASYGKSVVPKYRFEKAKFIVSIDTDFLGTYQNPVEYARSFASRRTPGPEMNKLVVFESILSLTGMNADSRIRIRPSQQLDVLLGLIYELGSRLKKFNLGTEVQNAVRSYANVAQTLGIEPELFVKIAEDLWENRGRSVVVAGGTGTQSEDALAVQIAANFLNSILNNDGVTVDHAGGAYSGFEGSDKDLISMVEDMKAGKVKTLLIHGLNPVYSAPASLGFGDALSKVGTLIYFGDRVDETGKKAQYIAPDHHHLENWGDAEQHAGLYSIQQPTIQPLHDTRAFQDSLLSWASTKNSALKVSWHDYLKNRWRKISADWDSVLQNGVVNRASANSGGSRGFRTAAFAGVKKKTQSQGLEAMLYVKAGLADGGDANNGWLQEMPDPVSKVTWDNYAMISPHYAETNHIKDGQILKVKFGDRSMDLPALVQPGVHDEVVGIALGYGREQAGDVGTNVGKNAYQFVDVKNNFAVYSAIPVTIEKTGGYSELANTQSHWSMEGRQIVAQATLAQYLNDPAHVIHHHQNITLWPKHDYAGYRWGMAVDLNTCTGCAACVVACQAENNIPVVGKKYIIQGREMHWMRIDRYYVGEPQNPQTVMQPMLCQHCENAPCETVCPVAATTHSPEGINEMTYNRCVGTRYCSNNCPYKVRRFNWFNYSKIKEPLNIALNPDVTVRSRGVMEKCTLCIHRITAVKMEKKLADKKVQDGDIVVACEQSCPTGAIVFGDMNDPESRVSKLFTDQRTYQVLEELNTAPSVRYLAKIRNAHHIEGTEEAPGVHQ